MSTRDDPWPAGTPCWVDLASDDPAVARAFYSAVLGWEIHDGPEEYGGYLMALVGGRAVAGIGRKPDDTIPTAWTTYLASDDADATARTVVEAGGQVGVPPMDVPGQGRMAIATDPAGASFGIWQAAPMAGFGRANEAGCVSWNELHTADYAGALTFYPAVFGLGTAVIGDTDDFHYSTWQESGRAVGGVIENPAAPGPFWMTYFASDDPDATYAAALQHGAREMMSVSDTPFGRMGCLFGPQGEPFAVIRPIQPAQPVTPTGTA